MRADRAAADPAGAREAPPDGTDDWDAQLERLEAEGAISSSWVAEAIGWLIEHRSTGDIGQVIDAGCGVGLAACAFAEALPTAQVTALDPTAAFLERALLHATERGVAERFTTVHGTIGTASPSAAADLVWASHVVHHTDAPVDALRTLAGWLTDRGTLAVAEGGLPLRVLPGGYGVGPPSLAARLDAAHSDEMVARWRLADTAVDGARDWPALIDEAGLVADRSRTFLVDHPAPLDDQVRRYVIDHHDHISDVAGHRLHDDDAAALDILLDRDDPRSLHRRLDLFLLTAFTVHTGRPRRP